MAFLFYTTQEVLSDVPICVVTAFKTMGCCYYQNGPSPVRKICFAAILFEQEESLFLEVIRHEYAHALVAFREPNQRHGHDKTWRMACLAVGGSGNRTYTPTPTILKAVQDNARYEVSCNNCGRVWRYLRAGRVVRALEKDLHSCTCNHCGSKDFTLKHLKR